MAEVQAGAGGQVSHRPGGAEDRKKADKLLREKQEAKRAAWTEKNSIAHGTSATVAARNLEREVRETTNARLLARLSFVAAAVAPTPLWHVVAELLARMICDFDCDTPVVTALGRFLPEAKISAHHHDSIALLDDHGARAIAVELLAQVEADSSLNLLCAVYDIDREEQEDAVRKEIEARVEFEKAAADDQPAPAKKKAGKKPAKSKEAR